MGSLALLVACETGHIRRKRRAPPWPWGPIALSRSRSKPRPWPRWSTRSSARRARPARLEPAELRGRVRVRGAHAPRPGPCGLFRRDEARDLSQRPEVVDLELLERDL